MDSVSPVYDDVMRFNAIAPGAQTRATAVGFEVSDRIGLYVTDYVDADTPMPLQISGNRANNVAVDYDGSAWTPQTTIYWGEGKSDVYAYYPYMSEVTDVNDQYFEVAADQNAEGAYEASDLLWAKAAGVAQSGGAVNLAMKHVMSKLTVKIVAGEDYIGSLPEDASVQLHSTIAAARVDLETGAVVKDPYSGAQSINMKKLGVRTVEGDKAVVYEAVVVPQMLESSVPLFEINTKSVSYLVEDPFNFRPGMAYTYTITLNTSTTAIKVEIGCELEDWNSAGSGGSGDSGEGGEGSGEGDEDMSKYIDLSAPGTANCYLVKQAGDYRFKAVIGNTDATVGNVKSVEVLWESFGTDVMPNVGDLIAEASYKNGYICFSTPENFKNGNAVIAAKNSKGTILWSWHIWCAEEGWQEQVYYNDAGTMMDRNLGATSATPGDVGALGLMYQWGRKDPFMGSASISEAKDPKSTGVWSFLSSKCTQAESEQNPMTYYSMDFPDGNWKIAKTVYDPCPAGWRVPTGGKEIGVWTKALGSSSSFTDKSLYDSANCGVNLSGKLGDDNVIWYPAMGYRGAYGLHMISGTSFYGYYNSHETYGRSYIGYVSIMYFTTSGLVDPSYSERIPYAYPVRCQKE